MAGAVYDDPQRVGRAHQWVRNEIRQIYEAVVLDHEPQVIASAHMPAGERETLEKRLQVEFERRVAAWREAELSALLLRHVHIFPPPLTAVSMMRTQHLTSVRILRGKEDSHAS
jgi:hypothetical protein